MSNYLTFLSYLKKQHSFELSPDGSTTTIALSVTDKSGVATTLTPKQVTLRGPGDILGINPRMITRLEPKNNTNDFEPNYFPFVEFSEPDFLWRYTVHKVIPTDTKITPWLSFAVISKGELDAMFGEGIEVFSKVKNTAILTVKCKYLPHTAVNTLSAHVQAVDMEGKTDIPKFISDYPSNIFCRLLCFRKLQPNTQYYGFLVPSFKASVNAAFGQPGGSPSELAWNPDQPNDLVRLPIYYQNKFTTSENLDFESLARALKPVKIDPKAAKKIGIRTVEANADQHDPNHFFKREGVLSAIDFPRDDFAKGSRELPLTAVLHSSLNETLASGTSPDKDPLISFPIYGGYFRKISEFTVPAPGVPFPSPQWLQELNLDFRNRVMAAFGTKSIQNNRDEYLKKAWEQVGSLREANNEIRKSKAAMLIARAMKRKHLDKQPEEKFILFTSPFHQNFPIKATGTSESIKSGLLKSGIVPGVDSNAFRKITYSRIPTLKKDVIVVIPKNKKVVEKGIALNKSVKDEKKPDNVSDSFLTAVKDLKLRKSSIKAQTEIIAFKPANVKDDIRPKFNMDLSIRSRLGGTLKLADNITLNENFDPLVAPVQIDVPLYTALIAQSNDYFLPGLEYVTNNGISMLVENRKGIESFMVGANHEMMRTFIFHSLFIDKRSTIFKYFWDPVDGDKPRFDVADIHLWSKNLGLNETGENKANLVVILKGDIVRRYPSTIITTRRIKKKTGSRFMFWSELTDDQQAGKDVKDVVETIEPVYRANIGNDILCLGFSYTKDEVAPGNQNGEHYIVLQENQDLPRLGLDVATRARRQQRAGHKGDLTPSNGATNDLGWKDVEQTQEGYIKEFKSTKFPQGTDLTPASIANSTYQLPMRVAIHVSHLINFSNG